MPSTSFVMIEWAFYITARSIGRKFFQMREKNALLFHNLTYIHRNQRHSVIFEDVDDFDGDGAAAGCWVGVGDGFEFQAAVFAGAEALPFVFEDVVAGPLFFEVDGPAVAGDEAGEGAAVVEVFADFDNLFAAV